MTTINRNKKKQRAIGKIKERINIGRLSIDKCNTETPELIKWTRDTKVVLINIFGDSS